MFKRRYVIPFCGMVLIILATVIYRVNVTKNFQKTFFSMDTIITIDTPNQSDMDRLQAKVEELNDVFDRHSKGTELYILNDDKSVESSELSDLILETSKLNSVYGYDVDVTSGNLVDVWNINEDPRIPTSDEISKALESISMDNITVQGDSITLNGCTTLDIGAVAKGYTLDVIESMLNFETEDTCISMGSSTLLHNVQGFSVSVRSPEDTSSIVCSFTIDGTSYISTSGGYERYIEIEGVKYPHILDLNTGYPVVTDLTSVTVCTDSGIKSDFLSTYVFMGGTKSLDRYLKDTTIKVIAIDRYKNIYVSDGLNVRLLDDSFNVT